MSENSPITHECARVETDVLLYRSGELDRRQREKFVAHIVGCAECRAALERAARVEDAYATVRSTDPGEIEIRRWMEGVGPIRHTAGPDRRWVAAGLALAAMIIVAFSPWRMDAPREATADLSWSGNEQAIWNLDQDVSLFGTVWETWQLEDGVALPSGGDLYNEIEPVRSDVELLEQVYPDREWRSGGGG